MPFAFCIARRFNHQNEGAPPYTRRAPLFLIPEKLVSYNFKRYILINKCFKMNLTIVL